MWHRIIDGVLILPTGKTVWDGDLDLWGRSVSSLGELTEVTGNATLSSALLTSTGNLKRVGGYLSLIGSNITELSKVEEVGTDLFLTNCFNFTSLGILRRIGRNGYLAGTKVTSVAMLEGLGGFINLEDTKVESYGRLKRDYFHLRL